MALLVRDVLLALFVMVGLVPFFSLHHVDEGHVGLYWRGGALLTRVTEPGFHLRVPFLDYHAQVQVTLQTDQVLHIPCGTSGGVLLQFDKIEVVNRLRKETAFETVKNYTVHYDKTWIYDKVHHEINQFCSKHTLQQVYIDLFHTVDDWLKEALQADCDHWAPGIEIIAVRITKPSIPVNIRSNYELMEAQKTSLLIAVETAKVTEKHAETARRKATIEAESVAAVSQITVQQKLHEQTGAQAAGAIADAMHGAHQKALADAESYSRMRQAEANAAMLTPAFLSLRAIEVLGPTTKIYFGPTVPSTFVDVGAFAANFGPRNDSMVMP